MTRYSHLSSCFSICVRKFWKVAGTYEWYFCSYMNVTWVACTIREGGGHSIPICSFEILALTGSGKVKTLAQAPALAPVEFPLLNICSSTRWKRLVYLWGQTVAGPLGRALRIFDDQEEIGVWNLVHLKEISRHTQTSVHTLRNFHLQKENKYNCCNLLEIYWTWNYRQICAFQ